MVQITRQWQWLYRNLKGNSKHSVQFGYGTENLDLLDGSWILNTLANLVTIVSCEPILWVNTTQLKLFGGNVRFQRLCVIFTSSLKVTWLTYRFESYVWWVSGKHTNLTHFELVIPFKSLSRFKYKLADRTLYLGHFCVLRCR